MESDLRTIMQRRRDISDSQTKLNVDPEDQSSSKSKSSSAMNQEMQEIMERRRIISEKSTEITVRRGSTGDSKFHDNSRQRKSITSAGIPRRKSVGENLKRESSNRSDDEREEISDEDDGDSPSKTTRSGHRRKSRCSSPTGTTGEKEEVPRPTQRKNSDRTVDLARRKKKPQKIQSGGISKVQNKKERKKKNGRGDVNGSEEDRPKTSRKKPPTLDSTICSKTTHSKSVCSKESRSLDETTVESDSSKRSKKSFASTTSRKQEMLDNKSEQRLKPASSTFSSEVNSSQSDSKSMESKSLFTSAFTDFAEEPFESQAIENSGFDSKFASFPATDTDLTSPLQNESSLDWKTTFQNNVGFDSTFLEPSATTNFQPTEIDDWNKPRTREYDMTPFSNPPKRSFPNQLEIITKDTFSYKFNCTPIANPLNGNIIFCGTRKGEAFIHEVDPERKYLQVLSAPILSSEMQRKVMAKYGVSVNGVGNVLKLTAGLHRSHGQTRIRVLAAIDLLRLDSRSVIRLIAIWQWGHGSAHPIALQYLLTPPSGSDYYYDHESLRAADNMVFIAGASGKGPCVFICKPSVRESWSANFMRTSNRIMTMAVTSDAERTFPYLAVSMADGSISIWTYAAALNATLKKGEPVRKLFFPLCRLEGLWVLSNVEAISLSDNGKKDEEDAMAVGYCTHLEWMPRQNSLSSPLMLAAGFQGGIAIFHVSLPVKMDDSGAFRHPPRPNHATQLNQTPQIWPFSATRWHGMREKVYVSWLDMGPHTNTCLSILLHNKSSDDGLGKLIVASINIPQYRKGIVRPKSSLAPLRILGSIGWALKDSSFPLGLLACIPLRSVICHSQKGIINFTVSLSGTLNDPFILSLGHSIGSNPSGLNSTGGTASSDTMRDREGTLHILTLTQCDRMKNETDSNIFIWSCPTHRYLLCCMLAGDSKESQGEELKDENSNIGSTSSSNFGDSSTVCGGSSSDVVCDLSIDKLVGIVPFRIVRCPGISIVAVLSRPGLGNPFGLSMDAVSIALVDYRSTGSEPLIEVLEGRDIVFLPRLGENTVRALVLSDDGSALSLYSNQAMKWNRGTSYRPILGVNNDKCYLECLRLFLVSSLSKFGLIMVCRRLSDGKNCIVRGPLAEMVRLIENGWSTMLPEMIADRFLWLEKHEEVFSLFGLPYEKESHAKLALATSKRVIILAPDLRILASVRTIVSSASLAPLGSCAVSFCSDDGKIRYLCCLDEQFSVGVIATLPSLDCGFCPNLIIAIRPDRFLYLQWHNSCRLVEQDGNPDHFFIPIATTRPALLLEAMVANAVAEGMENGTSTSLLRTIVEKFGRKVATITHGEDEGIGNIGAGLTAQIYEILSHYGLKQPASWLLTGNCRFHRSANSKILPPWMPVSAKANAALNTDAWLHLLANGDQYFFDYMKSPDQNMSSSLPRSSDPTSYLSREHAQKLLKTGNASDSIKLLDLVGSESSDSMLLQLILLLQVDPSAHITDLLKAVCSYDDNAFSRSSGLSTANASLAALAISLRTGHVSGSARPCMSDEQIKKWMKPLAPSLKRGTNFGRVRQRILGEQVLTRTKNPRSDTKDSVDPQFSSSCNESRHVWNEGPCKQKENLLLLDTVEDWLGRRRPVFLGKEGAFAAQQRGERTLADILNRQDEWEANDDAQSVESGKQGWAEGVGESRDDEDNLCGYFRFSEGEDGDVCWRTEGFKDLSRYQNKAILVGNQDAFSVQTSTSSVDEGERRVWTLFDLVFEESGEGKFSGLALPATRGNSIDVGMLHEDEHDLRQRCTLEFWYFLPSAESVHSSIVLARRTMGRSAGDLQKVCQASETDSVLWELVLLQSGELQFHSCGNSTILSSSTNSIEESNDGVSSEDEIVKSGVVTWQRWNHVCLVFNSRKAERITDCTVSLYMKGVQVASAVTSLVPHRAGIDSIGTAKLNELLQSSHLVFGLNHPANFRLTELRVWACERDIDDTKMMMYEYLKAANKKRINLKIKKGSTSKGGVVSFLAPPKGDMTSLKGGLTPPKSGGIGPPRPSIIAPPKGSSVLAPLKVSTQRQYSKGKLAFPNQQEYLNNQPPMTKTPKATPSPLLAFKDEPFKNSKNMHSPIFQSTDFRAPFGNSQGSRTPNHSLPNEFDNAFGSFNDKKETNIPFTSPSGSEQSESKTRIDFTPPTKSSQEMPNGVSPTDSTSSNLWDNAKSLSQHVRSSAASAIIRGPPATRHFGGNQGGLLDLQGINRSGVGGIAICGSEKTIVWRDEEDPPALTYPIGASGAIVSDHQGEEKSEFLCCFLAKEKRMVVFELNTRTVVVELQMTTKLNFWRYLPPEASEDALCFKLITPVGGFHWMPLKDSPRPRQVWKRGRDLQGKKIVSYEEGGTNGLIGSDIMSTVGLICVTSGACLEAWIIPISGDSIPVLVSNEALGAAFCRPLSTKNRFLPHLATVFVTDDGVVLSVNSTEEPTKGSIDFGPVVASTFIDIKQYDDLRCRPPTLAMGMFPEVICCTLGSVIALIFRKKGVMIAYDLGTDGLHSIAEENLGHFVVDAVMRCSATEGGAEIVMLLSDTDNPKDGRVVSFCFRTSI